MVQRATYIHRNALEPQTYMLKKIERERERERERESERDREIERYR